MAGFSDLVAEQNPSVIYEDIIKVPGSSWNHGWNVYDSAGSLVNFTGGTAKFTIRDPGTFAIIGSWTETNVNGRRIVLANGSISITSTPAGNQTLFTFGTGVNLLTYIYDLEVTVGSETVNFASGQFKVQREVSA